MGETMSASGTATPSGPMLGWRPRRRPHPRLAPVLAAGAGVFLGIATNALVFEAVDTNDSATAPGVLLNLALMLGAFLLGVRFVSPFRGGAVAVLVLSVPIIWFFVFFGSGQVGEGDVRGMYLLVLVTYALLYALGWTRGRTIFLVGILLVFAQWLTFEVQDTQATPSPIAVESESPLGGDQGIMINVEEQDSGVAAVFLVLGLGYLVAGIGFDGKRLHGVATPLIVLGGVFALAGAIVLGAKESPALAGVLAAAIGVAIAIAGALGPRRRASTWFGVVAIGFGLLAVLGDVAESALGVAGVSVLFAAGLGAGAWLAVQRLGETGDDPEPAEA